MINSEIPALACPVCGTHVSLQSGNPGALCGQCDLLINVSAKPLDYSGGNGQNPPDEKKMHWRRLNARRRLQLINPHLDEHCLLVDIGCGSGEMLLEGRSFFPQVLGYEVNKPLVNYAREKYALDVLNKPFQRDALPEGLSLQKKVFALSHVLEHLSAPGRLLTEIKAAAKPGDLLFVEVPLHTGESFRKLGYKWTLWNDEHLMLFSPKALHQLLIDSGFQVLNEGTRIFARGSYSNKTRLRLMRQNPVAFLQSVLKRSTGLSVADRMIADYGYIVAKA